VQLCKLAQLVEFPAYVNEAPITQVIPSHAEKQAVDGGIVPVVDIPPTAFADPANRLFPCHTKAATYVSYLYYQPQRADMDSALVERTDAQFDKFAELWNIEHDMATARAAMCPNCNMDKSASDTIADDDYAAVVQHPDCSSTVARYCPVRNATEVKVAAQWLRNYRGDIPFRVRQPMAVRILDKAAEYHADLGDSFDVLERIAGRGFIDGPATRHAIDMRLQYVKHAAEQPSESLLDELRAIGERVALPLPSSVNVGDSMLKFAAALSDFDEQYELTSLYDTLGYPEDVIFGHTLKYAYEFVNEACQLTNGSVYKRAQFDALHLDNVRTVLGDAVADSVVSRGPNQVDGIKFAEVAATLPRGDADVLEQLLADCGEQPLMKQATAILDTGELELFRNQYRMDTLNPADVS